MMIKNCTKFVLIAGIGFSLFSGLSHTAFARKDNTALVITNPSAPARLGPLALIHDDEQRFSVLRESGEINEIPSHLVARDLRGISQSEVKARLDDNIAFRVQQGSDGEFSLQEGGGLDGGWPNLGKDFGADAAKDIRKLGEYGVTVYGGIEILKMAGHGLIATGNGIANTYRFFWPTVENEHNTSLSEHPPDEGTVGIHSEGDLPTHGLAMIKDATGKMRVIRRPIEIKHGAWVHKNSLAEDAVGIPLAEDTVGIPLAEDTVGIPLKKDTVGIPLSAGIKRFNQLKMEAEALKVR